MSQTQEQQRFAASEVTADWHELMMMMNDDDDDEIAYFTVRWKTS